MRIKEVLLARNTVTVSALCELFGVSEATVRRDLNLLERQGIVERVHGGAVLSSLTRSELTYHQKATRSLPQKKAIARSALAKIADGDAILLEAGTTTFQIAKQLLGARRKLTIVTNSPLIAVSLVEDPEYDVILIGGRLRPVSLATVGSVNILESLHVDKAFLGTDGVHPVEGFTSPDLLESETKTMLLRCGKQRIVVADHTKIGKICLARFARITDVHTLITDSLIDEQYFRALAQQIEVVKADCTEVCPEDAPLAE